MFTNDPQKTRLAELLRSAHSLDDVLLGYEAGHLVGHVMLDMLEERGFPADEFDAVGCAAGDLPLALSVMHAAASRGMDINTIVIDGGGVRGPITDGDRIVMVSARGCDRELGAVVPARVEIAARAELIGDGELAVFTQADVSGAHE